MSTKSLLRWVHWIEVFERFKAIKFLFVVVHPQTPSASLCVSNHHKSPHSACLSLPPVQHGERLDNEIRYDRDFDYDFFGFKVCIEFIMEQAQT